MDAAIIGRIALETAIPENSVSAVIALLENGSTGPFIVHYRKEATGGLDEAKVRLILDRMAHYREVLDQRTTLLKTLTEQEKLTDELRTRIEGCFSKAELDDMHHQFRPRRKTRAIEAIEKGLQPLAEFFWHQEPDGRSVDEHIDVFIDPAKGVVTQEQALQGVVDIIAEWIWENFENRKVLREMLWSEGSLISSVVPAKVGQKTKYNMYYDRRESVTTVPSHRVLAIRRGCKEGILISSIEGDNSKSLEFLMSANIKDKTSIFAPVIEAAVRESYNRILRPMIETEVRTQLKERADREAIKVFQENLANLLLSPPAGPVVVMGVDWGKGNECSVVVVDEAGKFLEGTKIRLIPDSKAASAETTQKAEIQPEASESEAAPIETAEEIVPLTDATTETAQLQEEASEEIPVLEIDPLAGLASQLAGTSDPLPTVENALIQEASATIPMDSPAPNNAAQETAPIQEQPPADPQVVLKDFIIRHKVQAVAIGSGNGARELETALRQIIADEELGNVLIAAVNDAGIAIYSSSRIAREEFPSYSASARCAISLARRLQDPLSELVKIDPKLIGVGQYQHDVDQKELHRGLLQTVQFCVNNVGVNINAAGESILRYISGLNDKIARKLVIHRTTQGQFRSRDAIKAAIALDDTSFQQAAAFLRIINGENALDRTAVHPESYPNVEKMAASLGARIQDLIENNELIESIKLDDFVTETIGIPTLSDIHEELLRPGRDPRKTFKLPKFRADVKEMSDLKPGMILEGTVTNVTNFGAFIDIGVRQDGLVHLSQMSNRFIRDPREAVKVGDVIQVKVISVETETKRIGLSMKALLQGTPRRRQKPQRRGQKPATATHPTEGSAAKADTGANSGATPQSSDRTQSRQQKPIGKNDSSRRNRNKSFHKPERVETASPKKESAPKEPEHSLQEKIAILQSKFRGIK
jgi:protein Tex